MTHVLAALSQSISRVAAISAPLLCAIRVGPDRHMTGLVCEGGSIVTTGQDLPALDRYTVVLSPGNLADARPGPRDAECNLAVLHLGIPWAVANPEIVAAEVGNLAVVVGADADASPTVRLTVVHRLRRTANGPVPVLDVPARGVESGNLVLDAHGRLIGLASFGAGGEVMAIPAAVIGRMLMPGLSLPALAAPPASAVASDPGGPANNGAHDGAHNGTGRGWLGLALQPITVPDALVARTGQTSGRMVVSITKGGPADKAGLRIGDVLLALNGTGASGPHALRAFLGSERIGSCVEVRLLRDGNVLLTHVTVAAQPG